MTAFPKKLSDKLEKRKVSQSLRDLSEKKPLIDFSSNDYLGFAENEIIFEEAHQYLLNQNIKQNGATGSRLLSGNYPLYEEAEQLLAEVHHSEAALIFNSGYIANLGLLSSVPQRDDLVFYDEYIHASLREGITMGKAKAYKFKHNSLAHLKTLIERLKPNAEVYILTESVFSMDGDSSDLMALSQFCNAHGYRLIIDEAHALGVFGSHGQGLVQELGLEEAVFARIITFGKALGCHGAAVLGGALLRQYLINFARPFIYTTALPPHAIATIIVSYKHLASIKTEYLRKTIRFFISELSQLKLNAFFIESQSPIQSCIVPGNRTVKTISEKLHEKGFDVKAILSPTVQEGQERLRFCIHSFNTEKEISEVLKSLSITIKTHASNL